MGDILEIGGLLVGRATHRMEIAAFNVANMTTPGFKARVSFSDAMATDRSHGGRSDDPTAVDQAAGKLISTDNRFDLALDGDGYFTVRSDAGTYFTRNGQFQRDAEGRLVTASGMTLQSTTGDVVVGTGKIEILEDGTIVEDGEPTARLLVGGSVDPQRIRLNENGIFVIAEDDRIVVERPFVRQGMVESSNVSTAAEMLAIMAAIRGAETAQHIIQTYDDLMGRALNAFGQV